MSCLPVKISVVIPVYNVEQYLSLCVTSCINQTLNDVEFIFVNDGSTDRSAEILQEFAKQDLRIRVINQHNQGVSAARNTGLQNAQGQYIMFLDADDYLSPNACERVWCETREGLSDIVIFSSRLFPLNPHPIPWYDYVLHAPTRRYWKFTPRVLFDEPSATPFIWHQAFRKEILDQNGIQFDTQIHHGEDMIFLLKVYPHAQHFAFIQDPLYHYRWYREGSAMWKFQGDMDVRIRKHLTIVEVTAQYWQEQGWLEQYGKEYLQWVLQFVVSDIRSKETLCASEHYQNLYAILKRYHLDQYLSKVDSAHRSCAKALKKGAL